MEQNMEHGTKYAPKQEMEPLSCYFWFRIPFYDLINTNQNLKKNFPLKKQQGLRKKEKKRRRNTARSRV